jgi:hypothetical protein
MPAAGNREGQRRRAAIVFVVAALLGCIWILPAAAEEPAAARPPIGRPDAESVRAETHEILSDPRFAPRRTFLQWLAEQLGHIGTWGFDVGSGWRRAVVWVILFWGLLTIAAILGHIGWTLVVTMRGGGSGRGFSLLGPRRRDAEKVTFEEILRQMQQLAARGAYRQALGMMMLALVRQLEAADLLRFHRSKTNGDYVREYPAARAGRQGFRRFVLAFDALVYGGRPCAQGSYRRMHAEFQRILEDVRQEP